MGKRILVTGGAGFIGSHLCEALLGAGHDVVVVDNFCSGKRENLPAPSEQIHVIQGDVRALERLQSKIGPVDVIVHLAALISGYDSLTSADEYHDVNISGTLRVIEYARRYKVSRILFASSSTVYGSHSRAGLTETVLPAPLTVYALSKLAGEHLLDLYGRAHQFSHCSLRLFNVYGPRQSVDHPYANVTCKFSHAAANDLPVTLFGDGEQSRDFVYVTDVVKAFMAVMDRSEQAIYNVGTGVEHRINDLLRALAAFRGRPLKIERCDEWANDIRRIGADVSRFEAEFGFHPEVGLSEGLRATVDFFSAGS